MHLFNRKLIFIFLSWLSFAQSNQCIDGSPKNVIFGKTLQTSNTPLVKEFRNLTAFTTTEGRLGCSGESCASGIEQNNSNSPNLKSHIIEIPKECIKASLTRKIAQKSIECRRKPDGNWNFVRHSARSKLTPCINDTTVDYIHHVTNKVIACFQGLPLKNGVQETIDPKLLYSKINNESGFNFTYSYKGGVGAGQLTGHAVQEMNVLNPKRTKGRVVKGNGRFILDSILNSTQPECQGLKPIIQNDLKFKYHSPRLPAICEWVSMETGLARNLIYSMGYFTFLKHQVIGKELRKRASAASKDPEILNLLTMMGYGPGGMNRALTKIRTLNMGSATSLDSIKRILKKEVYLSATAAKLKEVKKIAGGSCRLL